MTLVTLQLRAARIRLRSAALQLDRTSTSLALSTHALEVALDRLERGAARDSELRAQLAQKTR
jgi:hypothetical protein